MEILFTKARRHSESRGLTDSEKIKAIYDREERLIGRIYSTYREEFIHFLRKMIKADQDVLQDIYSEAFCVLCDKIYIHKLTADNLTSSLKTYLFGIGKLMIMAHNRQKKSNALQLLSEVPDLEEEECEYSADNEKIVEKVVNELGEPCHSLLVLKFWKELSGEDIAAELGYKSADSVKNQRHRCMEKLREGLKNKLICN